MMVDNVIKLKKASNDYILNDINGITEQLLKYIEERISYNRNAIEELIKIKSEKNNYEEIERAIKEEINQEIKYKNYKRMYINRENFISTSLLMPVGIIAIEAFDTIEVVKYFIKAIKSRNGVAISDVEYDEQSVKFLILEIIKEALKKFNIDENLIMILPYEECFYKYFDKVIYTYNKDGENIVEKLYETKETTNQKYIYIENKELEEIAKRDNTDAEVLYGNIEDVIKKINTLYSEGATIYTKNPEIAYKFINLVHSRNVLVNTSLQNVKEINKSPDEMYEYKNIILPMPKEETIEVKREIEKENKETALVKVNESIFDKIKKFLKRIFGGR